MLPTTLIMMITFTITGTGFSTDITKDTVDLGYFNYRSATDSVFVFNLTDINNAPIHPVIMSATATSITFKLSSPQEYQENFNLKKAAVRVRTAAATSNILSGVTIKKLFEFVVANGLGYFNTPITGDAFFFINGSNFTAGCTMQMVISNCYTSCTQNSQQECNCLGTTVALQCDATHLTLGAPNKYLGDLLKVTISKSLFNITNASCTNDYKIPYKMRVKLTNGDGKVFETLVWFRVCS